MKGHFFFARTAPLHKPHCRLVQTDDDNDDDEVKEEEEEEEER